MLGGSMSWDIDEGDDGSGDEGDDGSGEDGDDGSGDEGDDGSDDEGDDGSGDAGDDGSGNEGDDGSGDESDDDGDDEIDDVANEDGQGDSEDDEEEVMRLEELNVVELREDHTLLHIGSVFMASSLAELERGVSDVRAEMPREYAGCIYTTPDMFPSRLTGEEVAYYR
ncbi:hypothetical protein C1H46_014223 [Malus baccata]|uniref:Uncharacterized protein n=1 Tax=Malus baccata TaxID=106549 RepID=A0A540MN38_MALBA|nr:hypothetical protein C1H46_014223 [Malus baccata]